MTNNKKVSFFFNSITSGDKKYNEYPQPNLVGY